MNEWISVEDKLPEPQIAVLATDGTYFCIAMSCDIAGKRYIERIEYELDYSVPYKTVYNITHWMELPELPSFP